MEVRHDARQRISKPRHLVMDSEAVRCRTAIVKVAGVNSSVQEQATKEIPTITRYVLGACTLVTHEVPIYVVVPLGPSGRYSR